MLGHGLVAENDHSDPHGRVTSIIPTQELGGRTHTSPVLFLCPMSGRSWRTELSCSDCNLSQVRRSLSEPFANETECSFHLVQNLCLSHRAARSSRVLPGTRRIIGQKESQCVSSVSFVRRSSRSYCWPCRRQPTRKSAFPSHSPRRNYRSMNNLFVLAMVIFGRPGIGPMPAMTTVTTGCQAHGLWLRNLVCSGLRPIGVGAAMDMFSTTATGASR